MKRHRCLPCLICVLFTGARTFAAVIEYDASSNLLPQNMGWSYTDEATPPANAVISSGILTLNSDVGNRAQWEISPVPNTPGNDGVFMEAIARIVSEQHTRPDRGAALPQIRHSDGVVESVLDLYAWEDRIFVNDSNDITVGTHFMDTTDALHTYRVELLHTQYWVFVDDNLVLAGSTPVSPSAVNGIVGGFGDFSARSGGITRWTKIRIGSLADIGGPTEPAPFSIYKWEYIDPNDPGQGKRESNTLTPSGYGLHAEPGLLASNRNLTMAYLQGADLTGSNFSSTNLANAYLNQANLTNALLNSTTLTRADLSQANLTNANLTGANLTGANLNEAVLADAIVTNAKLSSTHITLDQLYSTASYQNHYLTGVYFVGNDLSGADFAGQILASADFYAAKLVGADFSNADLTMAEFINADLSYANLSGADLHVGSLALADLSHASLRGANLSGTNLIGTNLTGADVRGARVGGEILGGYTCRRPNTSFEGCLGYDYVPQYVAGGINLAQLYTTASYQAHDLAGIDLVNTNLAGANFAGFNLTNAKFSGATLTGANLSGADTRGMLGLTQTDFVATNLIRPDGHVSGLDLAAGQLLVIRDYDGDPTRNLAPITIGVDQHFMMHAGGTLRMLFEADAWDSTIVFAPGIPVTLASALELLFAEGTDAASQIGRSFRVFNWSGVNPTGTFQVASPYTWNLTRLYTDGEVTLISIPEPTAVVLLSLGLIVAWMVGCARSNPLRAKLLAYCRSCFIVALLAIPCDLSLAAPLDVQLSRIGAPVWTPVDFQLFSAPATPFDQEFGQVYDTLLPYDSPSATTYTPHDPPYDSELSQGMLASGYVSQSVYIEDAITLQPNGVYFGFMMLPDPGATGSSRDFASGPVIPNSLFPIAANVDVWLDGVLVDRALGADALIPVQPTDVPFQGTSHLEYLFAIWHPWDDDLTVGPLGDYELRVWLRDAGGSGWNVVAPFQVVPDLPGDFNRDGTVDAADYVVWRKGLGTTYTQDDFNTWRANFGATIGAGTSSTFPPPPSDLDSTVPEPMSLASILLGVAALWLSPRRRVVAKTRS
jgi:uncharacterized protein YjbI with pentapeptide repeats